MFLPFGESLSKNETNTKEMEPKGIKILVTLNKSLINQYLPEARMTLGLSIYLNQSNHFLF